MDDIHASQPPPADAEMGSGPELTPSRTTASTIKRSRQIGVMIFVASTQLVQMFPYGIGIVGGLPIAGALHYGVPLFNPASIQPSDATEINLNAAWLAASYPLTSGTFVLIGGRLGEIFGHRFVMSLGCAWWVVWSFASGYADNLVGLCILRGMAGIGGGILVPNAVAMLGITFPPGKQRNLAMGLFGAMAPAGAAGGKLIVGIFVQLAPWRWVVFFRSVFLVPSHGGRCLLTSSSGLFGAVVFTAAVLMLEEDEPADPRGSIDYVGAYLGVAGLILFNFCWKLVLPNGNCTMSLLTTQSV
jgi:MFS family permease